MGFPNHPTNGRKNKQGSSLIIRVILGIWTIGMALGMTQLLNAAPVPQQMAQNSANLNTLESVDWVEPEYQLGHELYIENCSGCHIPIPPQLFPSQTWQQLLQDDQHYGATIEPFSGPSLLLVWNYMRTYSRSLPNKEDVIPYRFNRSNYFKALHPRVEFPQPVTVSSCVSCHPGASQYNYRSLTAEWQNSP